MRVEEYKETLQKPLRQATLCFLIRGDEVLLAMKKRGFGVGKWNGAGGKKDGEETIEAAAEREVYEEIGVTVKDLEQVAVINFYFPHNLDWGQQVHVYLAREWEGEPVESEEMLPKWFNKADIPFKDMWADDEHWLPQVLQGQKVEGDFIFGENEEILDHQLRLL